MIWPIHAQSGRSGRAGPTGPAPPPGGRLTSRRFGYERGSTMSRWPIGIRITCLVAVLFGPSAARARAQDGGDQSTPSEVRKILEQLKIELKPRTFALAKLPLQMRTAYAVGGIDGCETVLSISNFSKERAE